MKNGSSSRRAIIPAVALAAALGAAAGPVMGDVPHGAIKIGVLNDESGMLEDIAGPGSVEAARMAVEDFGGKVLGLPIQVLVADHQNKADVGAAIARQWFDTEGVDLITDLVNSSVALAVQELGKNKGRMTIAVTPGSLELVGKSCSPTGALWVYDTYATSVGLTRSLLSQGYDTWYWIGADYAFGHSMVDEGTKAITANGGRVLGSVFHPMGTGDFSSYILAAQSSGAKAIGLANAASDLTGALKQAQEFGLTQTNQRLVGTVVTIADVHAMGLETGHGLTFLTGFYWDLDDKTRTWSQRFFARRKVMPTMFQAGMYSAVTHYLKAMQAAGTDDARTVMREMQKLPVEDMFSRNGRLRPDGRMVHDMYLAQVKRPEESKAPWDYYKILSTIPGDQAFRPLSQSDCPLVVGSSR